MEKYEQSICEMLELIETCRYLAASDIYEKITSELETLSETDPVRQEVTKSLCENLNIQTMIERVKRVHTVLHFEDISEDWILGADMFGIQTHYRKFEDDPNEIIVKIEGTLDNLPLFEQMAVMHEIDLYKDWAPFCANSVMVDKIGKAELYGYICVGLPVFSRDFLFHAYGADCMQEHGKVVILGCSVEEKEYTAKQVPWRTEGWLHKRMHIKELEAIVEAVSPTAAKTKIIARVDLNAPLPHSLINFLIRKLAGILLYVLQRQALRIQTDHTCAHAERIRKNSFFYRDWLLPKFRHYCDLRNWEQPVISCLGEDGIPAAVVAGKSPMGEDASENTAAEESAQQQRTAVPEGLPVGAQISAVTEALLTQED